jgi:hypothetical protein
MPKVSLAGFTALHRARERAHAFELARLAVHFKKFKFFKVHAPRSFMHLLLFINKPKGFFINMARLSRAF